MLNQQKSRHTDSKLSNVLKSHHINVPRQEDEGCSLWGVSTILRLVPG